VSSERTALNPANSLPDANTARRTRTEKVSFRIISIILIRTGCCQDLATRVQFGTLFESEKFDPPPGPPPGFRNSMETGPSVNQTSAKRKEVFGHLNGFNRPAGLRDALLSIANSNS